MKKFVVEIEMENAAFAEGDLATELARILKEVIQLVNDGYTMRGLHDVNGNMVGHFEIKDE